jgi:hypothetical protein
VILRFSSTSAIVYMILALVLSPGAKAVSMSEAATTVTVTTVAGALLGASTLPFYEDSGANTKNIFYGAAVGAVVGVLLAAYSGVQDGKVDDEEEAIAKRNKDQLAQLRHSLQPEHSSGACRNGSESRSRLVSISQHPFLS